MKLESGRKENFADYSNIVLEQWKTYVEMANSNTEKRASANNIFITINLALLAVTPFSLDIKSYLLSLAGIAICILWIKTIKEHKKLSSVKFHIVNEIEERLPLAPFTYEWDKLNERKYTGLTVFEQAIPFVFITINVVAYLLAIIQKVFF